jgi:electron transfer flavoprotein beta subunit
LKIIVCVKQVPDSAAKFTAEGGQISANTDTLVTNPWDEYAIEAALQQKEATDGEVIAVSMGSESAKEVLKQALAMGADQAILVSDPALEHLDTQGAARVLATIIQKIGQADMVIFGRQAIDGDSGLTPAQTARLLGWPMFGLSAVIQVEGQKVKVERVIEEGRQIVSGPLPAVLSVAKDIGEPRYPSFMSIRRASKAEIPVWSLADLGIEAPAPVVPQGQISNPPTRETTCEIIEGSSPQEIAEKLADKILAEKIL